MVDDYAWRPSSKDSKSGEPAQKYNVGSPPLLWRRLSDSTRSFPPQPALLGLAHRIKPYLGFGVPVGSAYLSARRTFGRPIGRPKVRFNPSPPPCFGRKNGRRYGRTFGRPIGRPKVRFNPSPPLVVRPPYTNNPPPYILITGRLQWPQSAFCVHRLLCVPPCLWPL